MVQLAKNYKKSRVQLAENYKKSRVQFTENYKKMRVRSGFGWKTALLCEKLLLVGRVRMGRTSVRISGCTDLGAGLGEGTATAG